jgi:hypothetical protein
MEKCRAAAVGWAGRKWDAGGTRPYLPMFFAHLPGGLRSVDGISIVRFDAV